MFPVGALGHRILQCVEPGDVPVNNRAVLFGGGNAVGIGGAGGKRAHRSAERTAVIGYRAPHFAGFPATVVGLVIFKTYKKCRSRTHQRHGEPGDRHPFPIQILIDKYGGRPRKN
ncbi:hypothetical protein D3C87_1759100 [compost metagenome]